MMVRNPANRLVSLYFDKFSNKARKAEFVRVFGKRLQKRSEWWLQHVTNPLDNTRRSVAPPEKKAVEDISFSDMARFIASMKNDLNEHWMSIEQLCQPCAVQYDFVAKIEEAPDSSHELLAALGLPSSLSLPGRDTVPYRHKAVDDAKTLELNAQVEPAEKLALHNHYAVDYLLFNYSNPAGLVFT